MRPMIKDAMVIEGVRCIVDFCVEGACIREMLVDTVETFFFFFQAEDGIRDKLVTGVQTCALPISLRAALARIGFGELMAAGRAPLEGLQPLGLDHVAASLRTSLRMPPAVTAGPARSEERRVGKECRSRWAPYH